MGFAISEMEICAWYAMETHQKAAYPMDELLFGMVRSCFLDV